MIFANCLGVLSWITIKMEQKGDNREEVQNLSHSMLSQKSPAFASFSLQLAEYLFVSSILTCYAEDFLHGVSS